MADQHPAPVEVTQAWAARFWPKVIIKTEDECWPWTGGKTEQGYGRFMVRRGKSRPATQVAWELHNLKSFPAGMNACHTCDNPECVNPKHLWPGIQSDNIRDAVAKGRHASKPLTVCQRGHDMTGANRVPTDGGFRCRACAREGTKIRMRRLRKRRNVNG